jgi:hypothetical protein
MMPCQQLPYDTQPLSLILVHRINLLMTEPTDTVQVPYSTAQQEGYTTHTTPASAGLAPSPSLQA